MADCVESYSLWVMPKGQQAERLQAEIDMLSAAHNGPHFEPHVTVLPDIKRPREEVIAICEQLASQLKKYPITFLNVACGSTFHQCVYLLCAKDSETMEAAQKAREAYGLTHLGPYTPHCSLLYADIDEGSRRQVVAQEVQRLYGEGSGYDTLLIQQGFSAGSLSVWYTPVEDSSLASWAKVAEFDLQ